MNSLTLSLYFVHIVLELVVFEKILKNPIHSPFWVFFLIKHSLYFLNLDRRLHCLSLNLALRFATMSSSSSFSQTIRGTTGSTSASSLVLAVDRSTSVLGSMLATEDEDVKKVEAEREGNAHDGFSSL